MSKKVSNELVQSTDNSWIICKSKSYADRMYYFNTVTGTSVWNLSEPEIENAKRSSNFLRKSSNFLIDNCPEPSHSPTDNQPMKPMQYGISVPQRTLNVSETFIPVSETFLPLSSQNESRLDINNSKLSPFNISDSREILNNRLNAVNSECYNRNNETFNTKCDLREILTERRKKSSTNVEQLQSMISDASISECPNSEDNNVPLDMRDEEGLLDNIKLNRYNLNTCKLRNIANLDTYTDFWIVTDTNVLLNNTIFLTVLLHSDKQCKLVMPYAVLEEIQSSGKSHLNCQAKKALLFISQQRNLNRVIIDIERLDEYTLAIEDEILGCCSRLLVQGVPFVLLTNSRGILHIKERVTFPIFTIIEIKMLLCYQFYPKSNTFSSPLNINEASITVTIPNVPQVPIASPRKDTSYIVTDDHIPAMANVDEVEVNITDQTAFCEPNITKNVTESIAANTNINSVTTGNKNKIELKRNILIHSSASKEKWHIKRAKTLSEKANESNTTKSTHTFDDNSNESQISEYINFEPVRITDESKVNNYSLKAVNLNSSMRKPPIDRNQTDPKNPESSEEEKNVMFEISSKSMEDNLRTKCDEWVSRFTQIMEEMLTQVLLKEPKFACEAIPPPWSLYEAVECTKRKFHSDEDVVDATNKFCSVLFDIGASRGKVKSTISPKQYMDLYSYGVYLTDALQGVLNDCEDLQTASELLARLLKEIQDPHIDINTYHLNLFSNAIDKESEKVVELNVNKNERKVQGDMEKHLSNEEKLNGCILKELPQYSVQSDECQANDEISDDTSPPEYNRNAVVPISPSKYNLRSNRRNKFSKNIVQNTEIPEFFDSLHLIKTTMSAVDLNKRDEELNTEGLKYGENANEQLMKNNDKVSTDTNVIEEKNIEPKVVRNFVKCLDFEDRLQKKNDFTNYDDQENKESDYPDEASGEFVDGYQYGDDDFHEYEEEEELEDVDSMKCFLGYFINKTKRALSVVKFFCEKAHDVLRSSPSVHDKSEILLEAEETKISLTNICETLESILKRETSNSEDSIRAVSKNSVFNCVDISDEQAESYRTVISKLLEQGNILKESITCIIDVINI